MKVTITLNLKTREVYQLFQRKMQDGRFFMDAIFHKINLLSCRTECSLAMEQIKLSLLELTQKFDDESDFFEGILEKKEYKKITVHYEKNFHPVVNVTHLIHGYLIDFVKVYDCLIATLKLLLLAGCFLNEKDYYSHVKIRQKLANQMLSGIILIHKP